MMRHILLPLTAFTVCVFALAAPAASEESSGPMGMERMQHWAADHEALLDAKLAGLKAGLKLTSDQDKLWPPFETAVRDAAKLHMEHMKSMMERMQKMRDMMEGMQKSEEKKSEGMNETTAPGQAMSPVDRLEAMGQRMSEHGAAITKVAEAAKPLYASLDDSQKRLFALLGREMFMMGHGHRGMAMMHGGMEMMRGGMGGMGMMGPGGMGGKSEKMAPMENQHDEDDKDSGDD
ncbi:MAG: Spy/CpxP family protein refolding chaperone [Roseiarcus sp.]